MKRSPLARKSPLRQRSVLRSRPRPVDRTEPGRDAWKVQRAGFCQCGCGRFSMHLDHHHVLPEQLVRREGGDPWAEANGMYLARICHSNHHSAFRRIPLASVPPAALEFGNRLVGEDRAVLFFARYYGPTQIARAA